jgi:uncharacterized protein with HEPN domain
MDRRTAKEYLHIRDWLEIAQRIVGKGEAAYLEDPVLQEAGDSIMMKIGEAARRLAGQQAIPPAGIRWADAIANRNWVIHQYDEIDRAITWATLSGSIAEWQEILAPVFAEAEEVL